MTKTQFLRVLRRAVGEAGDQARLAQQLSVSQAVLSRVMNGKYEPTPGLLTAMGYRRVVRYERVK